MRETATLEKPWFARWPADVPRSLSYPDVPVQDLLRRTERHQGDRPAVTFYGKTLTYRDLDAVVARCAAGLRKIGVRAGDRVSLLPPNTPHFMVAFFAVLRAGAIVVQTNPILTPRELEVLWNDAGVETVVALDLFWHNLSKAKAGTQVHRVVVCDAAEFLRTPLRQLYPIKRKKDLQKAGHWPRSEEHTSELQSQSNLVCRLLLEKKKPPCTAHPGSRWWNRPRQPNLRPPTSGSTGTLRRAAIGDLPPPPLVPVTVRRVALSRPAC